jgi:hypothetical protein
MVQAPDRGITRFPDHLAKLQTKNEVWLDQPFHVRRPKRHGAVSLQKTAPELGSR